MLETFNFIFKENNWKFFGRLISAIRFLKKCVLDSLKKWNIWFHVILIILNISHSYKLWDQIEKKIFNGIIGQISNSYKTLLYYLSYRTELIRLRKVFMILEIDRKKIWRIERWSLVWCSKWNPLRKNLDCRPAEFISASPETEALKRFNWM